MASMQEHYPFIETARGIAPNTTIASGSWTILSRVRPNSWPDRQLNVSDSSETWAQGFQPLEVPLARIKTYDYDVDVARFWTNASTDRLHEHGELLAAFSDG
jgi:hypothetical protein